jgi:hypothetical protein
MGVVKITTKKVLIPHYCFAKCGTGWQDCGKKVLTSEMLRSRIRGNEAVNFSRFLVPLWREGLFDVWSRGFTAETTI